MQLLVIVAALVCISLCIVYLRLGPEDTVELPFGGPSTSTTGPSTADDEGLGPFRLIIGEMRAIVPRTATSERLFRHVVEDVSFISKIVPAIDADTIACIVPDDKGRQMIDDATVVILPEAAAFGTPSKPGATFGDVVIGNAPQHIQQKNPLIEAINAKQRHVQQCTNAINLEMDQSGDKMASRFERKSAALLHAIDGIKSDVLRACADQRSRLRVSHPHLSNYAFVDDAYYDPASSRIPLYSYGSSMQPVHQQGASTDDTTNDWSVLGLIKEYAALQ